MSDQENPCCCGGPCESGSKAEASGLNRRDFIQHAALLAGSAGVLAGVSVSGAAQADMSAADAKQLDTVRRQAYGKVSKYPRPVDRDYYGAYAGANLNRVAFPIGGIGAGMFCLEGTGAISHMSVRNRMEFFHEPVSFAALCIKGDPNVARVIEGPIPDWKVFGKAGTGNGSAGAAYGFPRFREAAFLARFPFATVDLRDPDLPVDVTLTGWSPFVPGDADNSSLPVGALEYTFTNTSKKKVDAVFSFNTKNFMALNAGANQGVGAFPNGFLLWSDGEPDNSGSFAVFVDTDDVVVDHSWFKGGWWDSMTLAWRNVQEGNLLSNPLSEGASRGASLAVPFALAPGKSRTVRLMMSWYAGNTRLRAGSVQRFGFGKLSSKGTADGQQPVTGFLGERLVNTFDPYGDGPVGTLTSPSFTIKDDFVHFLIAGGTADRKVGLELLVGDAVVRTASGDDTEDLKWHSWDVKELRRKEAQIRIVDHDSGPWSHVCVDHIIFSDRPIDALTEPGSNDLKSGKHALFEDFEERVKERWEAETPTDEPETPEFHRPWYVSQFENVGDVVAYWKKGYGRLREQSALFRDTFYDSTLPAEVVEAVAANLTILKSPTVLRQTDGRLWCWEGCTDTSGCCHGSCTHVWNYAQAIAHLFPELERTLRHTEYTEALLPDGRQVFRVNLPISPGGGRTAASDGQLGGIIKMYREWRISGDTGWLRSYWPQMKRALDFMIAEWDPRETGLLEEDHHNTYDISYFGPDGHCGSFYLGALTAFVKMGEALGEDVSKYRGLRDKGVKRLEAELFNGEYFYQRIMTDELDHPPGKLDVDGSGPGYRPVIELLNQQGPKYQYGTGCLSDGILGLWLARVSGIEEDIVDHQKVRSNLKAIHTYNLKDDLSAHANPQRPSFAMGNDGGLLLCTWPKGGALAIPFVYSDEVWTGIEYQVASHLMLEGMVEEGLEIVRVCRDRYDGVRRNPFNEYECGHWYARAMSSYGLLQGLTGARYDAVDKTLYIDSKLGDFRSFLSTASGFGTVGLNKGKPFLDVKSGTIDVKRFVVAGRELTV